MSLTLNQFEVLTYIEKKQDNKKFQTEKSLSGTFYKHPYEKYP